MLVLILFALQTIHLFKEWLYLSAMRDLLGIGILQFAQRTIQIADMDALFLEFWIIISNLTFQAVDFPFLFINEIVCWGQNTLNFFVLLR